MTVHVPGVNLKLARWHISPGKLVHTMMSAVVGGEHSQKKGTCLQDNTHMQLLRTAFLKHAQHQCKCNLYLNNTVFTKANVNVTVYIFE